ncbi:leucine--tRNA ligase [Candidatus Shapirobacteria bacterium CG09_land_8_20_14_0_10_38_17]|uniref:Leucine--tRNA ligase n=1 Tax=Candidatus Shapirobacteria bacterium CG09_land_8_20_14_0_10_38_17 TaxID=1974884 RepID=A0A2H0WT38_9BACT|nr:MAG: leucine--tRNA ligase [Candidatus Shapirobacteria bacterium CG09_land_8_20_14_0_10_38_17]
MKAKKGIYRFAAIEEKWQKRWRKDNLYQAVDFGKRANKFYTLVEFPYPSGEGLHIGHTFTMTGADIYARKKRMEGKNILFPMGWDAFGLPTENYAVRTGTQPQIVTKKNTDNFRRQMKKMAFSFDWSREINTTDPAYYKWTQWIFIQLFKRGLAYKKAMSINWCPSCKIGLANEEVIKEKIKTKSGKAREIEKYVDVCERCGTPVERRQINQWIVKITKYADRLIDGLEKTDFIEKVKAAQINWIGRSQGAKVKFPIASHSEFISESILNQVQDDGKGVVQDDIEEIEVFTTRPDTLWGATFMVIAPEHPVVASLLSSKFKVQSSKLKKIENYVGRARRKSDLERADLAKEKTGVFTGLTAINPVNKKKIPIWVSDFVLASYGTGAIMAVPAHDERDYAFAKKYNLPIIPVIEPLRSWDFNQNAYTDMEKGKMINSGPLNGLRPNQAIKKAVEILEEKKIGKRAVSYHLRDWIFSRQHYWGEPIPMVYCEKCAEKGITWWDTKEGKKLQSSKALKLKSSKQQKRFENLNLENLDLIRNLKLEIRNSSSPAGELAGWFPVPEKDLPVELPRVEKYEPTDTGESPLANVSGWGEVRCPVCGGPARRETDTMPNWAGSDWYYLAYVLAHKLNSLKSKVQSPKSKNIFVINKNVLDYWLPVDIYIGGDEHNTLHLLYSRFIYQFLYDIGAVPKDYPEPYYKRISHGVILGADGQRMSKSRGNIINPDKKWEQWGVDALRMYLMFIGPFEGTMVWNENALKGVARFLDRFKNIVLWSAKFKESPPVTDKDFLVVLNKTIKKVGSDLDNFGFNTAIASLMKLVNYLYESNINPNNKLITNKKVPPAFILSKENLERLIKLIAPFAPYLAEELWCEVLGNKFSVHQQTWPTYNKYLLEEKMNTIVVQVNGRLRAKIDIERSIANDKDAVILRAKKNSKIKRYLVGKKIRKVFFVSGHLINFVVE